MDYFRCLKTITQRNKNLIYLEEEEEKTFDQIFRRKKSTHFNVRRKKGGIQFEFKDKRTKIEEKIIFSEHFYTKTYCV